MRRRRSRVGRGVVGLLLCGALVQAGSGRSVAADPALARVARLAPGAAPAGSVALGALDPGQVLDLDVVLAPSNPGGVRALLTDLYDPRSPDFHRWLGPGQFLSEFGPTASEVGSATTWLRGAGLTVTGVSGLSVHVRATARRVSAALGVDFTRYRTRSGGRGYLARHAPLVPTTPVGALVQSILGLDTLAQVVPQGATAPRTVLSPAVSPRADGLTACSNARNEAAGNFYTLDQLGAAYGLDSLIGAGLNGHGETIGVYELAPHSVSDVATYDTCFGLTNTVSAAAVDGGSAPDVGGTEEADADIEQEATQAPGAAIISYEGPNTTQGQFDTWNKIVSDDHASVISTSWGECEALAASGGTQGAYTSLFTMAAAQGQSIFAASGDSGTEGCYATTLSPAAEVDYPASDPMLTAVGGTELFGPGDEVTWNVCQGTETTTCANNSGGQGAGGGGLSRYVAKPADQPEAVHWATGEPCGTVCRQVPDISANAGVGMVIFAGGAWTAVGGTSLSAPFMAGLVADKNDGCSALTGNLAPALYTLASEGVYGTALNDITSGDTDLTGANAGAYAAGTGYDAATGVGSPIAGGLACSGVSSVQPDTAAAGSDVTLTGLGLERAAVFFGSTPAQVLSATATSATVVVPAGSGSLFVTATSAQGDGTAAAPFAYPGSTPPASPAPSAPPTTTPAPSGYDLVGQDGGVFVFPTGQSGGFYGSLPGLGVHVADIVGMVPSPDDKGYFLVGQDGGVFAFGDAPFLGSLPGLHVAVHDIRGIVPTSDNHGYFLVGQDGGVFAFGDAPFLGSLPGRGIHVTNVIGIAATPSDGGYWVVTSTGTVYAFGNAAALGSATGTPSPAAGIDATPDGGGYWIVTQNGGVYPFGDARSFGTLPGIGVRPARPIIGLVTTSDDQGYWLIGGDGGIFAFGDAPFVGSLPGLGIHIADIVGAVPTTP
ncbi:MAG TPA: protease pro-enzyme activation domain-containing protein [Acidimicrobiales bacterium]